MKKSNKYICKIFIFVIFFIILGCNGSYGNVVTLNDGDVDIINTIIDEAGLGSYRKSEVLKNFEKWFGYTGELLTPLNIRTTVTITKASVLSTLGHSSDKIWCVKLGNKSLTYWTGVPIPYSLEDLKNFFGYDEKLRLVDSNGNTLSELQNGAKWDINMVLKESVEPGRYRWYLYQVDNLYGSSSGTEEDGDPASGYADPEGSFIDRALKAKEFLTHIIESIVTNFLNTVLTLGDAIQMLCNAIQSTTDEEATMFSVEDIKFEINQSIKGEKQTTALDDPYNLNSYVNYWEQEPTEEDSEEIPEEAKSGVEYTKVIPILDEDEGITNGFTVNTPIPVIRTDIYTLATDKIDFIKSNFLVKDNTEGVVWVTIRNFVASIIHLIIYFVAVLLLLSLIWHGVGLAKCSIIGSPEEKTKHIDAVRKFEIAFILLIGTLFIEAICLYLSRAVFDDLDLAGKENKYEGPIRVVVHLDRPNQDPSAAQLGDGDGFDISYHQGNDSVVKAIKDSGADFVILRAGITYDSGSKGVDKQFNNYYNKAKSLGLGVGAYYYTRATSFDAGRKEAEFIIKNALSGKQFEYPIYIDMEEDIHKNSAYKDRNTEAIKGFCETMKANGYCPGIYSSDSYYKSYMNLSEIEQYELWVANWSSKPKRVKDYGMWQKSSTTHIVGYKGNLDGDEAFRDYPNYMQKEGLNGYSGGDGSPEWSTAPSKTPDDTTTTTSTDGDDYVKMYSFSTTPTGYVRYMAGLDNIYLYGKKAQYTFAYLGLVIANFFATVSMILRMFLLMFLAVIGFIIIVKYLLKSKDASVRGYIAWVKLYAGLASIQVIFAVVARLLLMAILPKG